MRGSWTLGLCLVGSILVAALVWVGVDATPVPQPFSIQPKAVSTLVDDSDLLVVSDELERPAAQRLTTTAQSRVAKTPGPGQLLMADWTVRGRLVDGSDRPIAQARVVFIPSLLGRRFQGLSAAAGDEGLLEQGLPWDEFAEARTQIDGQFTLSGRDSLPLSDRGSVRLSGGRAMFIEPPMIVVEHPGHRTQLLSRASWKSPEVNVGELRLEDGLTLLGRVVGIDGQAIAGASVRPLAMLKRENRSCGLWGHEALRQRLTTSTAEDGTFVLAGLGPDPVNLEITASGWVEARYMATPNSGGESDLGDIVLAAGGVLTGTVVDGSGRPRQGVEVLARLRRGDAQHTEDRDTLLTEWRTRIFVGEQKDQRATTSPDGSYAFDSLPPRSIDLFAGGPGLEPTVWRAVAPGGDLPPLVVHDEARIAVTLVDAQTGQPVKGAMARAHRRVAPVGKPERAPFIASPSLTVSSGRAAAALSGSGGSGVGLVLLRTVGWAGTEVTFSAPGYATRDETLPGIRAPRQRELRFELWRSATLAGRIVDEQGSPVADAALKLVREGGEVSLRRQFDMRSNRNGRFLFDDLSAGSWRLTSMLEGQAPFDTTRVELNHAQQHDLGELTMPQGGTLAGHVQNAGGDPAQGVAVVAFRELPAGTDDPRLNVLTDELGHFSMPDIQPGSYRVTSSDGVQGRATVRGGEVTELPLSARRLPRVYGRVTRRGAPVENARLYPGDGSDSVITDANGEYEILVPVGPFQLIAWDDRLPTLPVVVELGFDQQQLIDLVFVLGEVTGVVRSGVDGTPVEGATAYAEVERLAQGGEELDLAWQARFVEGETDVDGRFLLQLLPGRWQLRVQDRLHQPSEVLTLDVVGGERSSDLDFTLEQGAALAGVVSFTAEPERPPRLYRVVAVDAQGREVAGAVGVDKELKYEFTGLTAGLHQVEVRWGSRSAGGLETVIAKVTIQTEAGHTAILDFSGL